jgi:hypothetical protein
MFNARSTLQGKDSEHASRQRLGARFRNQDKEHASRHTGLQTDCSEQYLRNKYAGHSTSRFRPPNDRATKRSAPVDGYAIPPIMVPQPKKQADSLP